MTNAEPHKIPLAEQSVSKRKVFYIGGFDHRGMKYYRDLYKKESAKQSKTLGCNFSVGPLEQTSHGGQWQINYHRDNIKVSTSYEYLSYDDLVEDYFQNINLVFFMRTLRFFLRYFGNRLRVPRKYFAASKGTFFTGTYPLIIFALIFLTTITTTATAFFLTQSLTGSTTFAILGSFSVLTLAHWLIKRYNKYLSTTIWLLNDFCYIDKVVRNDYDELDSRLDRFSERIHEHLKTHNDDEVLIVFYSFGTLLLPLLVDKLHSQSPIREHHNLSILSLGQSLSMVPCWPKTAFYKNTLERISDLPIHWHDFTSVIDGPCFPLTDIYKLANINCDPNSSGLPKILSARFHTMFSAEAYNKIKKDRFRVHFQYLMSTDKPTEYDYFLITAGNQTLTNRYKNNPSLHSQQPQNLQPSQQSQHHHGENLS